MSLERLKELDNLRTQGEWEFINRFAYLRFDTWEVVNITSADLQRVDAEFIALSANMMPKLLAAVRAGQKVGHAHASRNASWLAEELRDLREELEALE